MKYMYWIFLGVLIVGGIAITIHFGLQPKPVPKIKPSQIETPERMGEAVAQRLWLELKDTPLIFLGVDPEKVDHLKIWKGFFESLDKDLQYNLIAIEPNLPNKVLIPFKTEVDINRNYTEFVEWLKTAMEHNQRVAIVVPTIYSSQAIPENPINRLKADMKNPNFMTLSVVEPSLKREEETQVSYPCVTGSGDTRGLGPFGCMIQGKSRTLYRKTFESGKYLGLMDQIGATDYLVLFKRVP